MSDNISINLRTSAEKGKLLAELASKYDRSRNYLINQALDNYIEMQQAWVEGIEAARKEVKKGKTKPISQVFDEFEI